MYEIRRVDHNTYDVFIGKQWSDWTRVRVGRTSAYILDGLKLPYAFLKHLHSVCRSNMPINYQQDHEKTLMHCFNCL